MTHQTHPLVSRTQADAGGQVAQLRRVLALVEEIAGVEPAEAGDAALDEAARIGAAYGLAPPIVQRRFDDAAAEATAGASAGMKALLALQDRDFPVRAAAGRLAAFLEEALRGLAAIVSR